MLRSIFTAISGLHNHQIRLDVVANNIANINTVGFKKGRVNFQDILSQILTGASTPVAGGVGGMNPKQVGLGMTLGSIDALFNQGNLQTTGVNTDVAIQGNGLFILSDGLVSRYTRAGIFTLDANGTLVNASNGWGVQGWNAVSGVITPTPGTETNIVIPVGSSIPASATSSVTFTGNLDATEPVAAGVDRTASIVIYGSTGRRYTLTLGFDRTAAGIPSTWAVTLVSLLDDSGAAVPGAGLGATTVAYNANGSYNAGASVIGNLTANLAAYGENNLNFAPTYSSTTQYASGYTAIASNQNGYTSGTLLSFNIANNGVISGSYSNGLRQNLAQIALVNFANPSGLLKEGDNLFSETSNSGNALVGVANTGGLGSIFAGTLEMSNVDLSEEFTTMITAQRGFQANSRAITTSDEILQELLTLKR